MVHVVNTPKKICSYRTMPNSRRNVRTNRNHVRPEDLLQAMIALKMMSTYMKRTRPARNAGRTSRPSAYAMPATRRSNTRRTTNRRPRSRLW